MIFFARTLNCLATCKSRSLFNFHATLNWLPLRKLPTVCTQDLILISDPSPHALHLSTCDWMSNTSNNSLLSSQCVSMATCP